MSPYGTVQQTHNDHAYVAPHIYDANGELVWSGVSLFDRFDTFTFKVSNVGSQDMLTALYPKGGAGVVIDESYKIQKSVHLFEQEEFNMHELQIVDNGTRALYLKRDVTTTLNNSRRVGFEGGPCKMRWIVIEEKDIETDEVTFTWNSRDHIGLDESTMYENDPVELCENNRGHHPDDYL